MRRRPTPGICEQAVKAPLRPSRAGIAVSGVYRTRHLAARHLPGTFASSGEVPEALSRLVPEDMAQHRRQKSFELDQKTGVLNVWLDDDLVQTHRIPLERLPSGWVAYARLLAWLSGVDRGSVCLIEEPETHLHPTLQRQLFQRIGEIARDNELQLFIASHSPTAINAAYWGSLQCTLFEMRRSEVPGSELGWRERLSEVIRPMTLLEDLGVRASDILQSDGVIWVEGPSDRLYIKYWIDLFCRCEGIKQYHEGIDFSFAFYGGSTLSHFSVGPAQADELIDMLKLNRNAVVVIDNDLDFVHHPSGSLVARNSGHTKERVQRSLAKLPSSNYYLWITNGYTIESYLPDNFITRFLDEDADRRLHLRQGNTKVAMARRFIEERHACGSCLPPMSPLRNHIANVLSVIQRWTS